MLLLYLCASDVKVVGWKGSERQGECKWRIAEEKELDIEHSPKMQPNRLRDIP